MATVDELLRAGTRRLRDAGSESARLDAELLLGHALGTDRTALVAHPEAPVGEGPAATYEGHLVRRERGEPVAYIRGFKEFHGLAFATDPRALIPRPETERLVDLALREVIRRLPHGRRAAGAPVVRLVDVGTGAGTIAIALVAALRRQQIGPEVDVTAIDDSPEALDLARENAVGHGVGDRLRFVEADLLPPVVVQPWDVLLANLPYVASAVVDTLPVAASFEPRRALDGGADGLAVIGRLLERLPEAVVPGGAALLEIGSDQEAGVLNLVTSLLPGWPATVERDLAGHPRVAVLERPA